MINDPRNGLRQASEEDGRTSIVDGAGAQLATNVAPAGGEVEVRLPPAAVPGDQLRRLRGITACGALDSVKHTGWLAG
eukprot:COSAG05_NODE_1878_length_3911_cov_62.469576_2_plen_78_part_00